MILFRTLFALDVLVALVVANFFVAGLADRSVGTDNMLIWLAMIAAVGGVLVGAWRLNAAGSRRAANLLLLVLALPAILAAAFLLLIVILNPNWH